MTRVLAALGAALSTLLLLSLTTGPFPAAAAEPLTVRILAPTQDGWTNDTTPTISGAATPGARIDLGLDGQSVPAAALVGSDGAWSWTAPERLTQGGHRVSATASVGSEQVSSEVTRFTVDSVVPAQPSAYTEDVRYGATLVVRGTAESRARVDLLVDGVAVGHAIRDHGDSSFSVSPTDPVGAGQHVATVTATDQAGNTSVASAPSTFTVRGQPATVELRQGPLTNDQTPDVVGTAAPGVEVEITLDDEALTTLRTGADGRFAHAVTTPLGEGAHRLRAVVEDENTTPGTYAFSIDLTPPEAPPIHSPEEGQTVGPKPRFSGGGTAPVHIYVDGERVGDARWGSYEGIPHDWWDFDLKRPLASGRHTLTTSTVDAAGNPSERSAPVTFVVNTAEPAVPVLETPVEGGLVPKAVMRGRADPKATLVYHLDDRRSPYPIEVDASGHFEQPTWFLNDGPHRVVLTSTFPAGGSSTTGPRTFTVDGSAPRPPVVKEQNTLVSNDNTPQFSGTGEPGARVAVWVEGGTAVSYAPVGEDGHWSVTVGPFSDGAHRLLIAQVDTAGNSSTRVTRTRTIDTAAPAAPVISRPAAGERTPEKTLAIEGTGEAGTTVEVTVDGRSADPIAIDSSGGWRLPPSTFGEGPHTVAAVLVDVIGNRSPVTTSGFVVLDTTAPKALTVLEPADAAGTDNPAPQVRGTGEAGATVRVQIVGYEARTTLVGPDGGWSLAPAPQLSVGEHTLRALQTDAAGNASPLTTVTFLVRAGAATGPSTEPTASPTPSAPGAPTLAPTSPAPTSPAPTSPAPTTSTAGGASRSDNDMASVPTEPATASPRPVLARTGGPSVVAAVVGAGLVLAGVGGLVRRRRSPS